VFSKLTPRSEEDEEEEEGEGEKAAPPVAAETDGEEAEQVEGEPAPPANKRKNEPTELVEDSPDELRAVDKEMLNAEITQLEGEFYSGFEPQCLC
jgi:structural maintenance of chromosome 4